MKVYIAGKLRTKSERDYLEKVEELCKSLGLKTFLPHRDVGMADSVENVQSIFEGDIKRGFKDCNLMIAVLNGLHVGSGTAWELGYAYAKKIPTIGIKTDEPPKEALEYLSAIILASTPIVQSLEELKEKILQVKNQKSFK